MSGVYETVDDAAVDGFESSLGFIIVPYRNRPDQLASFLCRIETYLSGLKSTYHHHKPLPNEEKLSRLTHSVKGQDKETSNMKLHVNWRVIIVEQNDELPFNRGLLLNCAVAAISEMRRIKLNSGMRESKKVEVTHHINGQLMVGMSLLTVRCILPDKKESNNSGGTGEHDKTCIGNISNDNKRCRISNIYSGSNATNVHAVIPHVTLIMENVTNTGFESKSDSTTNAVTSDEPQKEENTGQQMSGEVYVNADTKDKFIDVYQKGVSILPKEDESRSVRATMSMKNFFSTNGEKEVAAFLIFHDVDILPLGAEVDLTVNEGEPCNYFRPKRGEVNHLYGHRHSLGGVFSVNLDDFIHAVDGFPLCFWGWGFEDHAFDHKCRHTPDAQRSFITSNKDSVDTKNRTDKANEQPDSSPDVIQSSRCWPLQINRNRGFMDRLVRPETHQMLEVDIPLSCNERRTLLNAKLEEPCSKRNRNRLSYIIRSCALCRDENSNDVLESENDANLESSDSRPINPIDEEAVECSNSYHALGFQCVSQLLNLEVRRSLEENDEKNNIPIAWLRINTPTILAQRLGYVCPN